jgi:hypothetical protein
LGCHQHLLPSPFTRLHLGCCFIWWFLTLY